MPEIYWLLLLLAGVAGWFLAQIFYKNRSKPKIPGEYLKGLNYLLNEQPDKALEVFIDLVDVDTETVETHLVLGNMFRRRGEVDRAIRIHQNLIARPTLEVIDKSTALLELAKDYLKAGLLDRAESLLNDVIEIGLQTDEAYPLLLGLYEQEKEWSMAIETTKKLEKVQGKKLNHITAHYYCELSEMALENSGNDENEAKKLAKKALSYDNNCARASVLLGHIAMHEENFKSAIKSYVAVAKQKPEYLPEVFMKLREAFLHQGDRQGFKQFLRSINDTNLSALTLSSLLEELREDDVDKKIILDWLLEKSELSLLEVNGFLKSKNYEHESISEMGLVKIQKSVEQFISNRSTHQCKQCGFHGKLLYWQCPSCHSWGTVVPVMPSLN
ncbi:MAG: lipopolysaccharide assembly protein LapB [Gammaproteobacteria bacterium]|nr:MAG: lipopolysaccharide assembly protein LapB [Gammaproteobacteria bacterium]